MQGINGKRDLWEDISDNIWNYISMAQKISSNVSLREHQFTMQHQWYLTPVPLAKMYNVLNECWRFTVPRATFAHV